ncbi:MAG: hypothetical protein WC451_03295 [Patescibacteria group bacterium]|jgi:hypothetical protein
MRCDENKTKELYAIFNEKYRNLFPEEWVIRLYPREFYKIMVIPDISKYPSFVLELGNEYNKDYYAGMIQFIKSALEDSEKIICNWDKMITEAKDE